MHLPRGERLAEGSQKEKSRPGSTPISSNISVRGLLISGPVPEEPSQQQHMKHSPIRSAMMKENRIAPCRDQHSTGSWPAKYTIAFVCDNKRLSWMIRAVGATPCCRSSSDPYRDRDSTRSRRCSRCWACAQHSCAIPSSPFLSWIFGVIVRIQGIGIDPDQDQHQSRVCHSVGCCLIERRSSWIGFAMQLRGGLPGWDCSFIRIGIQLARRSERIIIRVNWSRISTNRSSPLRSRQ